MAAVAGFASLAEATAVAVAEAAAAATAAAVDELFAASGLSARWAAAAAAISEGDVDCTQEPEIWESVGLVAVAALDAAAVGSPWPAVHALHLAGRVADAVHARQPIEIPATVALTVLDVAQHLLAGISRDDDEGTSLLMQRNLGPVAQAFLWSPAVRRRLETPEYATLRDAIAAPIPLRFDRSCGMLRALLLAPRSKRIRVVTRGHSHVMTVDGIESIAVLELLLCDVAVAHGWVGDGRAPSKEQISVLYGHSREQELPVPWEARFALRVPGTDDVFLEPSDAVADVPKGADGLPAVELVELKDIEGPLYMWRRSTVTYRTFYSLRASPPKVGCECHDEDEEEVFGR